MNKVQTAVGDCLSPFSGTAAVAEATDCRLDNVGKANRTVCQNGSGVLQ